MASNNWESLFHVAVHSLINLDNEDSSIQSCWNDKLQAVDKYFTWLTEIPEEIKIKFSSKSDLKLNTLPKTPSVKQRAQVRAHLKAIQEKENDTPEPEHVESQAADIISDSPKTRPKRGGKSRTTTSTAIRSLRSSRKPVVAVQDDPPQKQKVSKKRQSTDNETVPKTKHANCRVDFEVSQDNKSPSVRDRAHAYETMLNQKSLSPTKVPKVLTPCSAGRNFASATISSSAKASPRLVSTLGKSPLKSSPRTSKSSRKSASRRSKRSSRRSSKSQTEHPAPPTKPTRTKLALKKKSAELLPQPMEIDKENILSSDDKKPKSLSRDSALSSASSMYTESNHSESAKEISENESLSSDDNKKEELEEMNEGLDETHVVITEVFNVEADGNQELVEYEKVQTNSKQVLMTDSPVCDNDSKESSEANRTFTKDSPVEAVPVRTTRTRARVLQEDVSSSSSSSPEVSVKDSTASFTELKPSSSTMNVDNNLEEEKPRTTRTRTRVQKQQETETQEEPSGGIRTRTRQRLADNSKNVESSIRDVSVVPNTQTAPTLLADEKSQMRTTRSRMRQGGAEPVPCGYDEVVAGSPAMKSPSDMRASKKRPVEEYGNSPMPKRSRSCAGLAGGNSTFNTQSILLTSSPRTANGEIESPENEDTVDSSMMSPVRQCPKPYMFSSTQRQMSSFMKRTPAFAKTNSKVYSFLGSSTPSQNNSGALSSFLKRNTPTSKINSHQVLQEQKMLKLQEKERKEKERLRRAAEMKKQKLEEQKRLRDDRLRKVAEAREMKLRQEMEHKERINKKFEDKATLKDRMLEEKLKAETEKKEMREKKQMDANSRRRQEEDERIRKRAEVEEEARRQQEWMLRKKEYEEEERRKHLEEEKRKQEERLQKIQEEKAKLRKLEEEKRERIRKEREKQLALEKAEKERAEKEKREERERRLEEQRRQEEHRRAEELKRLEQEKLRAMEAAHQRAKEEALRLQKEREAKKMELQKLISQCKSGSSLNTSTGANSSQSYALTPDAKKIYKPSTNPNNYDIDDKQSDDSTDEEDAPKKKIPDWAMGVPLNTALIRQYTDPPDVNKIFRPHLVDAPDLTKLFPTSKQRHRFNYRTSSAVWTSPAMKKI